MIGLSKSRGALSMENQKMPEYETIRAAVAGEKWAVGKSWIATRTKSTGYRR